MCVRDTGLSVRETVRDTQAARRRSSIREASLVQFFDPTQTSADNGSATVLSSAINLCNTLMGTGLLAMPGVSTYDANMHDVNVADTATRPRPCANTGLCRNRRR